jgi:cation diffusion facilitator family transporter
MAGEAVSRILNPVEIRFAQAITVAGVGLVVNLLCATLLRSPETRHDEGHRHSHQHDHNLRAAFIHVVTDALTSVFAVLALLAVHFWNIRWVDPAVAILAALLIGIWAASLLRETSRVLLDAGVGPETVRQIRARLEADADTRVSDLHVWRVGGQALSVAACVVAHESRTPDYYRRLLDEVPHVEHSTIEVVLCPREPDKPETTP